MAKPRKPQSTQKGKTNYEEKQNIIKLKLKSTVIYEIHHSPSYGFSYS